MTATRFHIAAVPVGPRPLVRAAVAGCLISLGLAACTPAEPPVVIVPSVRTETVAASEVNAAWSLAAEVRPRTETRLSFRVGGKLLERPVQVGDIVKKGQLIARLDPQDLKLAEDAAQAGVNVAQAQLDAARNDWQRAQDLLRQGFISQAEFDRRDAAWKSIQAQVSQAQAQHRLQSNQSQHTVLRADAAGVVTAVEAEPGMVIAAGQGVIRVAQAGEQDIVFQVPEDQWDAARSLLGRRGAVGVSLWSEAGKAPAASGSQAGAREARRPATVREVAAVADPATRTFLVKAELVPQKGVKAPALGQTATVTLKAPGASARPAISLPMSAVFERQGRSTVWVLDGTALTLKAQAVELGAPSGPRVTVVAGLQAGQEVVTAGVHTLADGLKVRRYEAPSAQASAARAAP
jgi:membrane fusion protein, multidrug efflux system